MSENANALTKSEFNSSMASLHQRMTHSMVLQGQSLAMSNKDRAPFNDIHDAEFKVFSQFGEDGIIQYLINETNIKAQEESFIEFGVQNYIESNTRFLLINNNWCGLVLDGAANNIDFIKKQDFYWRNDLTAVQAWINKDNINQLISDANFTDDIGLLSVDIDGNDYWVWDSINVVNPVIVVVEYNSLFGDENPVSIPYDPQFIRESAHYSHLYYGASIVAFESLAEKKGYSLVCSNQAGNNLFFVRNDRLGRLKKLTAKEAYVESKIRESRDELGNLSFLSGKKRVLSIKDMSVINVNSYDFIKIHELGVG